MRFDDDDLEHAVRTATGRLEGDVRPADVQSVTKLNADAVSISALACLRRLEQLSLDCVCEDITPLASLSRLRSVSLGHAHLTDLTPLAHLHRLERIDLQSTPVEDLSPLAGLTRLRWLDLESTLVSDLSPLTGLPHLARLNVEGTLVSDLTPLKALPALKWLNIESARVNCDGQATTLAALAGRGCEIVHDCDG